MLETIKYTTSKYILNIYFRNITILHASCFAWYIYNTILQQNLVVFGDKNALLQVLTDYIDKDQDHTLTDQFTDFTDILYAYVEELEPEIPVEITEWCQSQNVEIIRKNKYVPI